MRNEQFSGDVTKLFTDQEGKNNDFLYKNFGLCQLIESLKYLRDDYQKFDGKFPLYKKSTSQLKPKKNKFDIYPALIVNEKMFHTPLFPQIFQEKFEKILNRDEFPDFIIRKLTIFHVEDLERLEHSLSLNKIDFWKLLREHHKKTTIVKPFYLTLDNKKINAPLNLEFQKYLNIVE